LNIDQEKKTKDQAVFHLVIFNDNHVSGWLISNEAFGNYIRKAANFMVFHVVPGTDVSPSPQ
jgi:hypothetical protein